jgi:hypothetical protein
MTGEAAARSKDTAEGQSSALMTWSPHYYALISEPGSGRYGERLTLCTVHTPPCIRHGNDWAGWWCQRLPGQRRPFPAEEPKPAAPSATIVVQLDAAALGAAVAEGVERGLVAVLGAPERHG